MSRMRYYLLPLWSIWVSGGPLILPAHADDDAKERFLAAYTPACDALRDRYSKNRRIRITATTYRDRGAVSSKFEHEFLTSDTCILCKTLPVVLSGKAPKSPPSPRWELMRPDHLFTIRPGKSSDAYIITQMSEPAISWEDAKWPLTALFSPLWDRNLSVMSYVRQPQVTVLDQSEGVWHGAPRTRVTVRETSTGGPWIRWLYFDAADHWLLYRVEGQKEEDGSGKGGIEHYYGPPQDGVAVPVKVEAYLEPKKGQPRQLRWLLEYSEFAPARPAASEFDLARFGLPEPADAGREAPSRWYVWLLVTAAAIGVVAVLTYRYARKRERALLK